MHQNRTLIRGDNLEAMREFPEESVDLIATDPPFNSKRDYFVPYRDERGRKPETLVRAFTDTWTWGDAAEAAYRELIVDVGGQVADTIQGLRQFLNETPMMAYLVMMGVRIVEIYRILKPTGSLYLHCDPTASHYLKIILDAVFDTRNFRNEIVWSYHRWTGATKHFQRMHDILLFYVKDRKFSKFNILTEPYSEKSKHKARRKTTVHTDGTIDQIYTDDTSREKAMRDVWEISYLNSQAKERVSYPTQKPIPLYKRIIAASSDQGELILDPFCGCGTTLMAAEELHREWIGIDLTYLAIGAVEQQFERLFPQHKNSVTITGTPENVEQALALAHTDPKGFEEWCVTHVLKFKSNAKKVADGGIDGTFRFPIGRVQGKQAYGKAVAQVKGGNYTLGHIRDFRTAMQNQDADLGIFVVTSPPSSGMRTEASRTGTYRHPIFDMEVPALQIYEIQDYFSGILPNLPLGERAIL